MVYERRHVAKSGRADGLPASRIIFFHLTTSFLQNLRSTILIKCSRSDLAATGQFLTFLNAQAFHIFCVWPPHKHVKFNQKNLLVKCSEGFLQHIAGSSSYLQRAFVSMEVIWWIFIGQLYKSGDERERERGREERCAVIFIGSCCAIMISSHQYNHHVSDIAATQGSPRNVPRLL